MKAFVLDPPRCTGCEACRVACCIENRVPMARAWRTVHHANFEHRPSLAAFHLSLACNHCERPACLEGCPAMAYRKDPGTGAVLLDDARCIGCRYCTWMCPYDAPRFDESRGVMAKCTFCSDRLAAGKAPACAVACPTGALDFEDRRVGLSEPEFPGLFRGGLGPALRLPAATLPLAPKMAAAGNAIEGLPAAAGKVSLRSEWTLWLFTLVGMALAGMQLGWALGGPQLLSAWAFLGAGGVAGLLSAAHLGRPERAWRAIVNLRSSWLSREVLAFGTFLGSSLLALALGARGPLAWFSAAAAIALLVSMDRVYQVAERRPFWKLRSSDLLPAGLQLAALAAGAPLPLVLLAGARTWQFLATREFRGDALRSTARVAALVVPALAALLPWSVPLEALLLCFLAGEALDRAGFYDRFETPSPASLLFRAGFSARSGDPA